jgi:hypothetical protein
LEIESTSLVDGWTWNKGVPATVSFLPAVTEQQGCPLLKWGRQEGLMWGWVKIRNLTWAVLRPKGLQDMKAEMDK